MLADVTECLRCPACGESLAPHEHALACPNGHAFDVAREGYVNLLSGHRAPGTADTPEMVRARESFLARGHYAPIADAVADAVATSVADTVPGCIVEIGAGTGYYLARTLARTPARAGVALDISKHAARRAARAHARIEAVVADAWARLPLAEGCAAAVLDVFAPRNADEIARVLHPDGALVVATPTPRHLAQLIEALGLLSVDADKDRRLEEQLSMRFERVHATRVERDLGLTHAAVRELVAMGPSARHVAADELERRLALVPETVAVTLAVDVAVFRPRPTA